MADCLCEIFGDNVATLAICLSRTLLNAAARTGHPYCYEVADFSCNGNTGCL